LQQVSHWSSLIHHVQAHQKSILQVLQHLDQGGVSENLGEWAIALHGRLLVPFWEMAVGHVLPIAHYCFIE
jgi:hypothetical protein